ncbi:hypothetical protein LEP1GSC170_2905 [Leptospira interrogans serovar Bataviae str. HAI135]|nr:hypothetical protein LEP1GSC170_2905 [Leptospira interrogans serovar Bataviae str. HAI135]
MIQNLPLTMMADSLRAVFIEGAELNSVIPTLISLFLYGIVFLFIGIKFFAGLDR